jgi:hypothetical protein
MKTVQEIQAEHARNAAEIMNSYLDAVDEIKAQRQPEAGAYLDRLTSEQKIALLREQAAEKAKVARNRALPAYREEVERYQEELAKRKTHLKKRLFAVEGPDGAAALSRTVTATEGELSAYLDVAEQAGNTELARAVFVAAERRGTGDLMARYFDGTDAEARGIYAEWSELPTESALRRQREVVEDVVQLPDLDQLTPWMRAIT